MVAAHEDAVDSLLGQHQQIANLFTQVDKSAGEHRRSLLAELIALIAVHENIEQNLVHPMAEAAVGAAAVRERVAEEVDAEAAFDRLYAVDVESPEFADELAAVRDAVIAHALAEEEQEFLTLRDADGQRLTRLVAVVAAAPALAATLSAGPPAEVFDQARTAVRRTLGLDDGE